jgi:hypothetical protein
VLGLKLATGRIGFRKFSPTIFEGYLGNSVRHRPGARIGPSLRGGFRFGPIISNYPWYNSKYSTELNCKYL